MMRRIKIIANKKKKWAKRLVSEVIKYIEELGCDIVERGEDTTICIGGDGTILYAHHYNKISGAVIGIGSDTSYICQLNKKNWRKKLNGYLKGKKERRLTLVARASKNYKCLNDIVIHAVDYRIVKIFVHLNKETHVFQGDGVIISTPTGTSGYAYSAGGKLLNPTERKVIIVPICPYRRAFGPVIADSGARITVECNKKTALIIDGMLIKGLRRHEKVNIKKGNDMNFVK